MIPGQVQRKNSSPMFANKLCIFMFCGSVFPSVKWGQAYISTTRRNQEHTGSLGFAFVGAGVLLNQAQPLHGPGHPALPIPPPAFPCQWQGSAIAAVIWRAALLPPLCCVPRHHLAQTPPLHLRTLILDIQRESGDGGLNSRSAPNSPQVSFCSI